jgi:hypothetical protein
MNKQNCIRKGKNPESRKIVMSIRISNAESKFMKDNNFAPSLIFYEALKNLGFKGK